MDEVLSLFLQSNYSSSQIRHRLNTLKNFLQARLFNSSVSLSEIPVEDKTWLESLDSRLIAHFNPYNMDTEFKSFEQKLHDIKPLTIFLPFQIPDEEVDNLGRYIRQNFKPDAVLEIKFDGNLIGGAALSWNGVYKDYSIRSLITQNQTQLIEAFKNYLH